MSLVPGTGAGQKLSPTQIYQLAIQGGFSITDAVAATAIALAESGGQTNVINSIGATGLWQIYDGSYPSQARAQQMSDPLANARAAYAKYVGSQKTQCGGWWPWATYDEGPCAGSESGRNNAWRGFLGMSQAAATGVDIAGGGGSLVVGAGDTSSGTVAQVVQQGGAEASGGGAARQLALGSLGPWNLSVGAGLLWALLFTLGAAALLLAGLYLVFREQINTAVGKTAEVAAVAAA